jgi:hypothetical protein
MSREESRSPSPNQSRSPRREARRRSRSPRRETERPRRKEGGFKWKEKRRNEDDEDTRDGDCKLERGYKEHYRARSPRRNRESNELEPAAKRHEPEEAKEKKKDRKDKKKKQAAAVPPSGEAMIIVNVNDRLGTKAAIPCYASDPISQHRCLHYSNEPD